MTDPTTDPLDPTLIRSQPSLTVSTGRIWLVVGAIGTAVYVVVLTLLLTVEPLVAGIGLAVTLLLFLAMVVVRLVVPRGVARLRILAVLFTAESVLALVAVVVVGTATAAR